MGLWTSKKFFGFASHAPPIIAWTTTPVVIAAAFFSIYNTHRTQGRLCMTGSATIASMLACLLYKFPHNRRFCEFFENNMSGWYREIRSVDKHLKKNTEKTIFLVHPHGILSIGWSLNMVWNRAFHEKTGNPSKGKYCKFLIDDNLRKLNPWFKVYADLSGRLESASKANVKKLMKKGANLALMLGGFEDASTMVTGRESTVIKKRKVGAGRATCFVVCCWSVFFFFFSHVCCHPLLIEMNPPA